MGLISAYDLWRDVASQSLYLSAFFSVKSQFVSSNDSVRIKTSDIAKSR